MTCLLTSKITVLHATMLATLELWKVQFKAYFTSHHCRFTQNLSCFRRDINDWLKASNNNSSNPGGAGVGTGVGGTPANDMMT